MTRGLGRFVRVAFVVFVILGAIAVALRGRGELDVLAPGQPRGGK
jgi:hypothetical protein